MLIKRSEELNLLQLLLLAFVKSGLTAPYDLISQAGLSVGLSSPAFKRLEEAGLLTTTEGPRRRTDYALTEKGREQFRASLDSGLPTYWEFGRQNTYESMARVLLLLWVSFGREEAERCIYTVRGDLEAQAKRKHREAESTKADIAHLESKLFRSTPDEENGALLASSYRWLKTSSEADLLERQAEAVGRMTALLEELPKSLEKTLRDDRRSAGTKPLH